MCCEGEACPADSVVARVPDAPQAWEAEQLLATLTPEEPEPPAPPPERPGNFRLQLGAFRTVAAAETEVRRLAPLFENILPGPVRIVTPVENRGSFFLLQSAPVNGQEADAACRALRDAGQDCLRINR